MILGTFSLSAGWLIGGTLPARGPIPFASWDADGSGTIEEAEFNALREQRQAMVKTSGYMGRNMANAPTFAQIDKDDDGRISPEELTAIQQGQWCKLGMGRYYGAGRGMTGKMGRRYQAMDAESKEKYNAFFTATTKLRQEIMAKRAEKRAVMRSTNPDPDQAAQLTRELLDLRGQLVAQAEEAGVAIALGRPGGNRSCGRGNGGGPRW